MTKYKILFDCRQLTIIASGMTMSDTGNSILFYKNGILVGAVPITCAVYAIEEKESEK